VNTYTGWTARGWASATAANATVVVTSGSYSVSADATLYGAYQRTLTVTYNANGGSSTPASTTGIQYTNSSAISATANPSVTLAGGITKAGSLFDGWVSSVTGTKHSAGATVSITANTMMTAAWVADNIPRFQVTYNATENGGTTASTTAQVAQGSTVDLTLTAAKPGWTFVGWNTNKDAKLAMTALTLGSTNVTLYAIYSKAITATLIDVNGTTQTTRTISETMYNKEIAVLLKIPAANTYTGWSTRGWSLTTAPDAPVKLVSGNQTTLDNVTLYAVYVRTVSVTFNANGGSTIPAKQVMAQYVNSASLATPTYPTITLPSGGFRTGYVFDGWVSSVSGTKSPAGAVATIEADTVFTASWR
ncbi:MAG: InlB B-repeat-containing protein, partial [Propionibacteriaceae bacterium]|nr:InlB B-repeat-containing protein [Propionibacteriaceae bacterium]